MCIRDRVKAEDDNLNNTLSDLKQKDNIYQKQIAAIGVNDINEYYHLQKEIDQLYFKQNGNQSSSGQDKFLKAEITVSYTHLDVYKRQPIWTYQLGNSR